MKRIILILLLFISIVAKTQNTDSATKEKTGWLVYVSDKIIFVEAKFKSPIGDEIFFEKSIYENGAYLNGHYRAEYLRQFAHKYKISQFQKPKKGENSWVSLLPVRVKTVQDNTEPTSLNSWTFYRNSKEVQLWYRFLQDYNIEEITPFVKLTKTKK
jgi:hypothetical protein